MLAAILHMSSAWGFFALISSGIVWAVSRTRSRFLLVQALQAFLFQLSALLGFGVMFLLFMAGFYFAAFSGLIARTGVTEPELTRNLIIAAIIGFTAIFFFRFVFPLAGIWAGIQILRGKSYLYPALGNAVVRYTSRQPFVVQAESSGDKVSNEENDRVIAALGHGAMFAGFSLFLSPILWVTAKKHSPFLTHNLFQASLFQMAVTLVAALFYFIIWGGGALLGMLQFFGILQPTSSAVASAWEWLNYLPFGVGIMIVLCLAASAVCVVIAVVQSFRGKEFTYPLVGKWLLHYMNDSLYPGC
ncbi:MAG: DUF4870 domain-containing protein [Anaerolineales bacterium]